MSAEEMTANGEVISGGAAQKIDEAIGLLLDAQRLVASLQIVCNTTLKDQAAAHADHMWHKLETIDDRIHDALARLGN